VLKRLLCSNIEAEKVNFVLSCFRDAITRSGLLPTEEMIDNVCIPDSLRLILVTGVKFSVLGNYYYSKEALAALAITLSNSNKTGSSLMVR